MKLKLLLVFGITFIYTLVVQWLNVTSSVYRHLSLFLCLAKAFPCCLTSNADNIDYFHEAPFRYSSSKCLQHSASHEIKWLITHHSKLISTYSLYNLHNHKHFAHWTFIDTRNNFSLCPHRRMALAAGYNSSFLAQIPPNNMSWLGTAQDLPEDEPCVGVGFVCRCFVLTRPCITRCLAAHCARLCLRHQHNLQMFFGSFWKLRPPKISQMKCASGNRKFLSSWRKFLRVCSESNMELAMCVVMISLCESVSQTEG
jgi:hypothetical protein